MSDFTTLEERHTNPHTTAELLPRSFYALAPNQQHNKHAAETKTTCNSDWPVAWAKFPAIPALRWALCLLAVDSAQA